MLRQQGMYPLQLRVRSIREVVPSIKSFELVSNVNSPLPAFEAGAHIEVAVADTMSRCYSLLNDPVERHRYVVAVLLEEGGQGGSVWMHETLREGDCLRCGLPANGFPLNEAADEHVLIAGGIGITPILSMVHRLQHLRARFSLHYCTQTPALTAYRDELIAMIGSRVIFHHDGGDPRRGLDLDRLLRNRSGNADLYICGPRSMIEAARQAARGWPPASVHFELFSPASDEPLQRVSATESSFMVELARSKRTLEVPPHKSLLTVLTEHGFSLPSVCREGWCGTCRVHVLDGKVDHRDDVLDDNVKASHSIMQVCVSRALPGERLILDL